MSTRLRQLFATGSFARSISLLVGSTAIAQAIALLVSPLVTRLYTPESFGVLGIYASILGVLGVLSTLRFELAVPIADSEELARDVVRVSLVSALTFGLLLSVLILFFGDSLLTQMAPTLVDYSWLIPAGVVLVGFYQTFNYWAIRHKAFSLIGRTRISQAIVAATTQVGWGITVGSPFGLLFGHAIGQSVGIVTLSRRFPMGNLANMSISPLLSTVRRFKNFPLIAGPGALLNTASTQAPTILLAAIFGPAAAGLYALTQRIVAAPLQLIGNSVNQVFFAYVAQAMHTHPETLIPRFVRLVGTLLGIALIPAILAFIFAPNLFAILFGEEWRPAGEFTKIMVPMLVLQFAISPVAHLNILERQDLNLYWNIFRALIVAIAFGIAILADIGLHATITLYASSMALSYLLMAALWLYAANRIAKMQLNA